VSASAIRCPRELPFVERDRRDKREVARRNRLALHFSTNDVGVAVVQAVNYRLLHK
jgi:hypothetical protein